MIARPRRIDHLVLAVRDLERAAAFYERLGFQVGARNRHPWGTQNHIIQFTSSFLELITAADAEPTPPHSSGSFSFGAFVQGYLSRREGLAMLALDSDDAKSDAAEYARLGIGDFEPFSFERSGRAADGTRTHVAFTLAFAVDERLPDAAFFVCQQHYPDAFWSPFLRLHTNGATNVADVTLEVVHPRDHTDFLQAFTGKQPSNDGRDYHLDRGGSLHLESNTAHDGFAGFSVSVPDLGVVVRQLVAENIPFQGLPNRLVVAADHGFGARIEFVSSTT
jgi:catechol 2,3-dioxygenase-like lactoylglutathione lyase family enzyme